MTDKQRSELENIKSDILKLENNLINSEKHQKKYEDKLSDFNKLFEENKGFYIVQGLICIAVLIFDFFVSTNTLQYLAQILKISVEFLAVIFSLLDGGIAILASGGLAGTNTVIQKKMRRTWRPVLFLLGFVKIVLFGVLIYNTYYIVVADQVMFELSSFDLLRIVVTQIIFILIIYAVLTKAGFGLWYLCGGFYYSIWKFLLSEPDYLKAKLKEELIDFRTTCENYKLDFRDTLKKFDLEATFDKYIQG
jgi:hypothetical protein